MSSPLPRLPCSSLVSTATSLGTALEHPPPLPGPGYHWRLSHTPQLFLAPVPPPGQLRARLLAPSGKKEKKRKAGTLFPKRLLALRKYGPDVFGNRAFGLPGMRRAPPGAGSSRPPAGASGCKLVSPAGTIPSLIFEEGVLIQKEVAREERDSPEEGRWDQVL